MAGATEEVGKAVGGFMSVMGAQPLSLALVVMNLVLLGYLFYIGASTNKQRSETVNLIVDWQRDTEKLLASCVSSEVTRIMLDNMQKITDTMLQAEQKEVTRMQKAIDEERNRSWELRQREQKQLDELRRQQQEPPQPKAQRLSSSVFKLNLPPIPPLPTRPFLPMKGGN